MCDIDIFIDILFYFLLRYHAYNIPITYPITCKCLGFHLKIKGRE